jgi:hypothetical protein
MRILPLFALALLPACAATIPPVEVTRFHLNQNLAPGGLETAAAPGLDGTSIEFRTYAIAVGREMARLGFGQGSPAYRAEIGFDRDTRERLARRSPVSIGIGGGSFGRNVGFGLGTSFGIGGSRSRDVVVTRLSVRLVRKSDQSTVWEGRAETEAPERAPAAQPGLAAEKLARALFAGFPGESGRTITVE